MWNELKRMRESEVNGVVVDLNCASESRYWYSTAQTTKVGISGGFDIIVTIKASGE